MEDIPELVPHQDLLDAVAGQAYMHAKKTFNMPLGSTQLVKMSELCDDSDLMAVRAMQLIELGAQPLILDIPPMLRCLVVGCGCKKCEKRAQRPDMLTRGWASAYDVMMFYATVIHTNAIAIQPKTGPLKYSKAFTVHLLKNLAECQFGFMKHNNVLGCNRDSTESVEASRLWANLDRRLRLTDDVAAEDEVPSELLDIAFNMVGEGAASYTLEMLHRMETAIWIMMCAAAPESRRSDLANRTRYWTPETAVRRCGTIPEADKEMREFAILRQSQALRLLACGDKNGRQFKQWPSVHIPSHAALTKLAAETPAETDWVVPLDSACYTALSFYHAGLVLEAATIGATQPRIASTAGQ